LRGYVAATVAAGLAALALAAPGLALGRASDLLFFVALCALAQMAPVPLVRNSSMSVAFAFGVAALMVFGPATAVWVQLAAGLVMAFVPHRKPLGKAAFNAAAVPFQQALAGWVYVALGGAVGPEPWSWSLVPPAIVAVTLFVFANTLMLSAAIALETGSKATTVFDANYRWLMPAYVGVGLTGLAMGVAANAVGLAAVTIFFIPLSMAWYSYKLYMAKTEEARRRNHELGLANAQLDVANAQLRDRVTELSVLGRTGLALGTAAELGNSLGDLASAGASLVAAQGAAVLLLDQDTGALSVASAVGIGRGQVALLETWDGPVARSVGQGAELDLADTTGSKDLAAAGIGALHGWPLRVRERVVGAYLVTFASPTELSAGRRAVLSTLAEQASTTVQNARLNRDAQESYLSAVRAVVAVVDAREGHAPGHAERVKTLAGAAAASMGLSAQDTSVLETAALFHDVGLVSTPDAVLARPSALTPQEWADLREHPLRGAQMLGRVPGMERAAKIVAQHHERHDGQGYPAGLLGGDVDPLAQLLAVVDAYAAMTSRRPHRAAMSPGAALVELRAQAGHQFAPKVVEAFVKAVAESPAAVAVPSFGAVSA
jgi:putative nucleotidyltransferase with HDIG domain